MINKVSPQEFSKLKHSIPLIDVRSPSEYLLGHIHGSISLPLFTDQERAEVGTCYKQKGREAAILLGLKLIGPEIHSKAAKAKELVEGNEVIVYCWRGGMRSNSMAWLLDLVGYNCKVLEGGYKAYRNGGKALMENIPRALIIGGYTGSGKTKVLKALEEKGEQFLDIEALARHRGSSFGAIGQEDQMTNEQFENELIECFYNYDLDKTLWIEDESRILGSNHLPEPLYNSIRNNLVIKLELPLSVRADVLVEDYAHLNKDLLQKAIKRIERKLGGQLMKETLDALDENDYHKVAVNSLKYYDQTYGFGLSKRDPSRIITIEFDHFDADEIASHILEEVKKIDL